MRDNKDRSGAYITLLVRFWSKQTLYPSAHKNIMAAKKVAAKKVAKKPVAKKTVKKVVKKAVKKVAKKAVKKVAAKKK